MSGRFIDWDGDPNSPAYWWHEHADGTWAQEIVQNTDEILKVNHHLREHTGAQDKEVQMTHQIPIVCARIWQQQYGIDIYQMNDEDAQEWMERNIFSSNEWYKLRTSK
jgi:hypothetical protein